MNYIYDILINNNNLLFDFYEWDSCDDILHIRKIPFFRVNNTVMNDLKNNEIVVSDEFIEKIKNKTDVFNKKKISDVSYSCLFSDSSEAICLIFDKNGNSLGRSKLLVDEEMEVLEVSQRTSETEIRYNKTNKIKIEQFKTRKELEMQRYLEQELTKLELNDNLSKIEYLSYECFNKNLKDKSKIINEIRKTLEKDWDEIAYKLHDFFKLTSIKK